VETIHLHDVLGRPVGHERLGITETNLLDVAGQVIQRVRRGTNGTATILGEYAYDTAGRLVQSVDALGAVRAFTYAIDDTLSVVTETLNGSPHRVERRYPDGRLERITGPGVHPVRFTYGVVTNEPGAHREFSREIQLMADNSDTTFVTTRLYDGFGNVYKILHHDGAYEQFWYDTRGHLFQHRDADNVVTLHQYNALGELEFEAVDLQDRRIHR